MLYCVIMAFHNKLIKWRDDKGLSQKDASGLFNITQGGYSILESGKHPPRKSTIEKYTAIMSPVKSLSVISTDSLEPKPIRTPAVKGQDHNEVAKSAMPFNTFAQDISRPPESAYQPRELEEFRRMQPKVKSALRILEDATFWVDAKVKADPDNDYDEFPHHELRDEILVKLYTKQLKGIRKPQSFRDTMKAQLMASMGLGYGVAEPVWEARRGIWWIKTLKNKPTWDFHPWIDEFDNLFAIYHFPTGLLLHPDRMMFTVWPYIHMGNFLGIPEIESIRQNVELLNKNKEARNKFIHKLGILPLVHAMDTNKMDDEEIARRKGEVNKLESMSVLHTSATRNVDTGKLQPDSELSTVPTQTNGPLLSLMSEAISSEDVATLHALGIPNGVGLNGITAATFASSRVNFDAFLARPDNGQKWIAHNVEEQIFVPITRFNYPSWLADPDYNIPRYVFEAVDEEALERRDENIRKNFKERLITLNEARADMGKGDMDLEVGQVESE